MIIFVLAGLAVLLSLSLALYWSVVHHDVQSGFTMGAYIVAVGAIVLGPIQAKHTENCVCFKKEIHAHVA